MSLLYKLFRILIRVIVIPLLDALKSELNWESNTSQLQKRVEELTAERVQISISEKVSEEIVELRSSVSKLEARVKGIEDALKGKDKFEVRACRAINKLNSNIQELQVRLTEAERQVNLADRMHRVKVTPETDRQVPGEADTGVIEW